MVKRPSKTVDLTDNKPKQYPNVCAECIFWRRGWRSNGVWTNPPGTVIGQCSARPPAPLVLDAPEGSRVAHYFSMSSEDDYCGDFDHRGGYEL